MRQGYRVQAFANGAEALKAVKELDEPVDLLITDIVLPGMNGRVLAEEIRALRPKIKVLFASGYSENVVVHHGVLDQGLEFVAKPYSLDLLARRVREVLDQPG
jgi:DNA-binding response OmpR family regulator